MNNEAAWPLYPTNEAKKNEGARLSPSVEGCWENCKWRGRFYTYLPLAQR